MSMSQSPEILEIQRIYEHLCRCPSDINEHLPVLCQYASKCNSVIETGVRGCISTWAIAYGLLSNPTIARPPHLVVNDIQPCEVSLLQQLCMKSKEPFVFQAIWKNNLEIDLNVDLEGKCYDMLFIDTWHVYGQLKRELNKFEHIINKYIVMHDTTVDEIYGETIRCKLNAKEQSKQTGIPIEEINIGLGPAIDEFLIENPQWRMIEKLINNNGLTILQRMI